MFNGINFWNGKECELSLKFPV